ncbi:Uncharacterised protein [Mycobacterium tuberculosis]|nr:Uncharacterised protein [Mycobacterium tuberculosis]
MRDVHLRLFPFPQRNNPQTVCCFQDSICFALGLQLLNIRKSVLNRFEVESLHCFFPDYRSLAIPFFTVKMFGGLCVVLALEIMHILLFRLKI